MVLIISDQQRKKGSNHNASEMKRIEHEHSTSDIDLIASVLIDNLCRALRKGYPTAIVELKQLVIKGKITPESVDEHGSNALHAASQGGLLEAVSNLFQKGFDFNPDFEGNTPLHIAYLFGHESLIDWFKSNGADPSITNKYGIPAFEMTRERARNSIFQACIMNRTAEVLSAVKKEWIHVDERDECNGRTLFLTAAENGNQKLMSRLITLHANISTVDTEGNSALHIALSQGHVDTAEFLLERDLDSEAVNSFGLRPRDCFHAWRSKQIASEDNHPSPAVAETCRKAQRLYSKASKQFLVADVSKELANLRILFDESCTVGTQNLGVDKVRAGRSIQNSRSSTMDYLELCKFLERFPECSLSKATVHSIFKQVSNGQELTWQEFQECLLRIAREVRASTICNVSLEDLESQVKSMKKGGLQVQNKTTRTGIGEAFLLQPVSIEFAKSNLQSMQRQMNAMASRAKDVTACKVFLRGPGLTTGKHRISDDTLDVYSQLLAFPKMKLKIPAFQKPNDIRKNDFLSKSFFTDIDQDKSGTLTSYELKAALDDYGFTQDEQSSIFQHIDSDKSGVISLSEFVQSVSKGEIEFIGRVSKSKKQESDLKVALATSKSIEKKAQPDKFLSLSPGLFGQIFRIYSEYAMKRLSFFEERSCIYRAPHLSAVAQSSQMITKSVVGINTRFAAVNPFDHRVLAAFSPENHCLGTPSPIDDGFGTPAKRAHRPSSADTLETSMRPHTAPISPSSASSHCISTPIQSGSPGYRAQQRAINPGLFQGLSPSRRKAFFSEPGLAHSPDGKLLSEHTRITLIPHRLSITDCGQLLIGGVETIEERRSTGTVALQAVKRHRVTLAGLSLLGRILFRSLSAGSGHCAGVSDTGLVFTWGQGRYGQLGHGDHVDRIIPQPVQGIRGVTRAVSAGFYHTIAVTRAGSLFSWGDGREGKLGHNDDASRPRPTLVHYFSEQGKVVAAAQAGGSHTVALTGDGCIFTFGAGQSGRLGHGNDLDQHRPMLVASLEFERCVSVAAGFAHTAALCGGKVYTWGSGRLGRLGHGTESDEVMPRRLELCSHASIQPLAIAAGEAHTCVYRSDGSMVTLGRLTHGRYAEGCVTEAVDRLTDAMRQQSADDWHHFSS